MEPKILFSIRDSITRTMNDLIALRNQLYNIENNLQDLCEYLYDLEHDINVPDNVELEYRKIVGGDNE